MELQWESGFCFFFFFFFFFLFFSLDGGGGGDGGMAYGTVIYKRLIDILIMGGF